MISEQDVKTFASEAKEIRDEWRIQHNKFVINRNAAQKQRQPVVLPEDLSKKFQTFQISAGDFLDILSQHSLDVEKAKALSFIVKSARAEIIADEDRMPTLYAELFEILTRTAELAQKLIDVTVYGKALDQPAASPAIEAEVAAPRLLKDARVDSKTEARSSLIKDDQAFFLHYRLLKNFQADHEEELERSAEPCDWKLNECVGLSLSIAQDYLRGLCVEGYVASSAALVDELKEKTASVVDAGGKMNEFPYAFFDEAVMLAELVHDCIRGGVLPNANLQSVLLPKKKIVAGAKKPEVRSVLQPRTPPGP